MLDKRDRYIMAVITGVLANTQNDVIGEKDIANYAVNVADNILSILEKRESNG